MSESESNPDAARRRRPKPPPRAIGWREWLAIPSLGVDAIKAKVDTGARSSALHAFDMEIFEQNDDPFVRYSIHPNQDDSFALRVVSPLVDRRSVRPSTGVAKVRPVVRLPIQLGSETFETDITLVRRDMMGFRMLLGRRALKGRFLVDVSRSFVFGSPRPQTAAFSTE